MATIQINVSEALVARYGIKALQERVQREIEWEEICFLAEDIQQSFQETAIDSDSLSEIARQKAWNKFKIENKSIFEP
jgi:hypothetical protein